MPNYLDLLETNMLWKFIPIFKPKSQRKIKELSSEQEEHKERILEDISGFIENVAHPKLEQLRHPL